MDTNRAETNATRRGRASGAGLAGRKAFYLFGPYLSLCTVFIAWEVAAQREIVIPFLLPALSSVLLRIVEDFVSGALLVDLGITIYRTLAAFGLATIIGVSLGIVISRVVTVRWICDPIVSVGLPMPKIALLPVFMLWFGLFDLSKILIVAFSASFQIIIATWAAALNVEKELIWSARSLGASKRQVLFEVILPAALPQVLTGLQIAMPVCLIVVLVTEMVMGGQGLGDAMLRSARFANSTGVFAGIIEIGIVGFCIIKTMEIVRRRLLVWHQETITEASV